MNDVENRAHYLSLSQQLNMGSVIFARMFKIGKFKSHEALSKCGQFCMFCKLAFFSSPPHPSLQSNLIDVISALVLSTYPHLVDAISDAVLIFAFVLLCSLLVLIFVSLCNTILLMLYQLLLLLCSSLYQSAKQSPCSSITRPRNIC